MLTYEPKDRLNILEIANHPWLAGETASAEEVF